MRYQLHITKAAQRDIVDATDYIEYFLKNPIAADHLLDLIEEKTFTLSSNPKIHPLVEDSVLYAWGIRFVVINNYLAFYKIDESKKIVYIIRFLYSKRDWRHILKTESINTIE